MKTGVPTVSPQADLLSEGYRVLQESGMRAVPVVKEGELAGMLTVDDLGQASLLRDKRRGP
jgi:CBS domain-containing protein